jgi:hypothetical protein
VEKDFHLEIGLGRRVNKGILKWVLADWSHNDRVTPYNVFHIVLVSIYVSFNGDRHVYMGIIK